ncbi:hypothetical protein BH09SUM1_BH09SUM1_11090 [soil metagenome]
MSLIEVMIAATLAVGVIATSIGGIVFYQKTTLRNDRGGALANLMENQMERIRNRTWYQLSSDTGLFPPGGPGSGIWPGPTDSFTRYKCDALSLDIVKDGIYNAQSYSGLGGNVEVYYTPVTLSHSATTSAGAAVFYDINYYKVEVIITLDDSSRIRAGSATDQWALVTYISELGGKNDADFSAKVLATLRDRVHT